MKRRKFATAAVFTVALLAAALAAASVSAAASSPTSKAVKAASAKTPAGVNRQIHWAGKASFAPAKAQPIGKPVKSKPTPAGAEAAGKVNRVPPRPVKIAGFKQAPSLGGVPQANSLPITTGSYYARPGLGSITQATYGAYEVTPSDNALGVGGGFTV